MGNGSFDGVKFTLYATMDFSATSTELALWRAALQAASTSLFFATDGLMSIGKITVSNHKAGLSKADLLLTNFSGASSTYGTLVPQVPGNQVILRSDEVAHPGVIVHEFGHYLFSLKDEYKLSQSGSTRKGTCTHGPPTESACLMEYSSSGDTINLSTGKFSPGVVRQFCCQANHSSNNNQHVVNGKSCWQTIVQRWGTAGDWGAFPAIVGPASGTRPNGSPSGAEPDPLEWIEVVDRSRIICLLSDAFSDSISDSLGDSTGKPPSDAPGGGGAAQADFVELFIAPLLQIDKDVQVRILAPDARIAALSTLLQHAVDGWRPKVAPRFERLSLENLDREIHDTPASNQRMLFHGRPAQLLQVWSATT